MKERPILFNGEMVRAILEGRKTMTRRVVKPQPTKEDYTLMRNIESSNKKDKDSFFWGKFENYRLVGRDHVHFKCPFGEIGDRLWVRETFNSDWCDHIIYKADGGSAVDAGYAEEPKWKPSIFMPRRASRITLETTNIRVERLNDISDDDALAEGIIEEYGIIGATCAGGSHREISGYSYYYEKGGEPFETAIEAYKALWESIYSIGSWANNPKVWVEEFKKV